MEPFFYTHKLYFVFIILYPLLIDEHVLVLEPKSFIAKSKRDNNLTLLFDQRSQTPVRYLKWNSCISLAVSSVRILNERHMSHSGIKSYYERVVDRLPLMTYGLKLRLEPWILKFKKRSFNNLRFNELQLFGNSNFFL